jgi:hypothetical protein
MIRDKTALADDKAKKSADQHRKIKPATGALSSELGLGFYCSCQFKEMVPDDG